MVSEQGNDNGQDTQAKSEAILSNSLSSNESSCTTENSEDNAFGIDLRSLHPSGSKNEVSDRLDNNISASITETSKNGDSQIQHQEITEEAQNLETGIEAADINALESTRNESILERNNFEVTDNSLITDIQGANSVSPLQCIESLPPPREILNDTDMQTIPQFVLQSHKNLRRKQNFLSMSEATLKDSQESCSSMLPNLPCKDSTWNINNASSHVELDNTNSSSNVCKESQDNNSDILDDYDSLDGAVSLPLSTPAVVARAMLDDDVVVTVDRKKPFKLPSLVNLFEAAEAQRVELEENARALSDVSVNHRQYESAENSLETRSSNSSDGCNSDTESQQASKERIRSKKV